MKLVKSKKGMSLIEIIISLAILGIVSTGIITFFTNSFRFQARIQEITKAQKVADAIMEDIKNGRRSCADGVDVFDNTTYEFEVIKTSGAESGNDVVGGIKLSDVTVKTWPERNKSIVGEASSTIREVIATNPNANYCEVQYSYRGGGSLTPEKFYFAGEYYINPFKPFADFTGWEDQDGNKYGHNISDASATIKITNDMMSSGTIIVLEAL